MKPDSSIDIWTGRLAALPRAARVMLSAFLVVVGAGYLVAAANIYHSHAMADGRPGLSRDDVRAVYGGLTVTRSETTEIPSRMLAMLRGAMRQYVDSDADYVVLETWLKSGGGAADMDAGEPRKTPRRAMIRNCLRCHGASTGTDISRKSPFGPDELEVDHAKIAPLTAGASEARGATVALAPQYTIARLVLVSHVHMLAIPMFTLAVGLMFMQTRLPRGVRTIVGPAPMVAMALDFAGWWLARWSDGFVWMILVGGAVFGVGFGVQITGVLVDLWRPARIQ